MQGNTKRPRVVVYRSNKYIYAQMIDDTKAITLAHSSDKNIKKGTKVERATAVGEDLAGKAIKLKVKTVVFDRGGYRYHGRVKAVADGIRSKGVQI
jgi:large subunit ribosomal protein L18